MRFHKRLLLATLLVAASPLAFAQATPEEHAAHHPPDKAAPAEKSPQSPAAASKSAAGLQENMTKMQALMDKLENTKDAAERQKLLAEHREAMREQLAAVKGMACGMGTAGMGMGGAAGEMKGQAGAGNMMSGDMMKCHEMMQARMNMMVGMMEQMMRHEDAAEAMGGAGKH